MKNQKYPVKMPAIPKEMKCTFEIAPCLVKMKYDNHGLLAFTECTVDPFEKRIGKEGDPKVHTP